MDSQKLFYLAGKCLTLDEFPGLRGPVGDSLSAGEIPIDDFVRFCDRHLALPCVYRKLREHGLTAIFPPELAEHLEDLYLLNEKRNNGILRQMEEISATLRPEGIAPVYLKGAAHLLDGLYSAPGERLMGDIDFLVRAENYLKAAGLLMELGYETARAQYDDVLARKHYPPLLRADVPAAVEIHQVPVNWEFSRRFTSDMVLSRKEEIADKENCYVPCDEHKIIHTLIHNQRRRHRFKHTSLRGIYDLYRLSKRVKPATVLPRMEAQDRAKGDLLFAAAALGLGPKFYATDNRKAQRHCVLSDLALKHPRTSKMHRKILKLSDLILKNYLGRIIKATYQQSSRQHILRRIKDPHWYKRHAAKLKKTFLD